jgi:PKD repeat protein
VRSGPGTNYPVIGSLSRGQSAVVTGANPGGDWLRFDYLGREGWVARSLVTLTGDVGGIKVAENIPPSPVPTNTPLPPTQTPTPAPTRTPSAAPAPQASFRADKTRGVWPLPVQFTDTSTNAVSWAWNFGDGATSTVRNPSHTYQRAGNYRAELTVTNSAGQRSVSSLTITVAGSFGVHAETLIGPFGKWGNKNIKNELAQMKYCPIDQVAIGFNIKVLGPQGSGDDKALTGIRLVCGKTGPSGVTITDEEWSEGTWGDKPAMCPSGSYLVSARLRINENPVDRDQVGATNASFVCTDGRTLSFSHTAESGTWADYQRCPTDTVICGIKTRVVNAGPINYPDYMGVADATFACCYSR